MILGALQSIPEELWEAAKIDGASAVQRFWHVTLPMLKPVLIASTRDRHDHHGDYLRPRQNHDKWRAPALDPDARLLRTWQEGFRDVNFGYGAAMSVVMLVTLCIATLFYLRVSRGSMREGDAAMAL